MDHTACITYIVTMSSTKSSKVTFKQLGGWRGLVRNPGLVLFTLRRGAHIGEDAAGNQYYERPAHGGQRARRWVVYAGAPEASTVGPEWHSWLHYVTAEPLPYSGQKPWQKPHLPNLTGTALSYRPPGHDYEGGKRAAASSDYESWTPEN